MEFGKGSTRSAGGEDRGRVLVEGMHRSIFAGLSQHEKEGAKAAWAAENLSYPSGCGCMVRAEVPKHDLARLFSRKGAPCAKLLDLLKTDREGCLPELASIFGVKASPNKDRVARRVFRKVTCDPEKVFALFVALEPVEYQFISGLYRVGGHLRVSGADLDCWEFDPRSNPPLMYLFYYEDAFEFVMPNEILRIGRRLDWNALDRYSCHRDLVGRMADMLVELRGIASLEDLFDECRAHWAGEFDEEECTCILGWDQGQRCGAYCTVSLDGHVLLVHGLIYCTVFPSTDIYDAADVLEDFDGNERERFESVRECHRRIAARRLPGDMVAEKSFSEWVLKQPAVAAFGDFLDDHVPDTCLDYLFAENVMEKLYEKVMHDSLDREFSLEDGLAYLSALSPLFKDAKLRETEVTLLGDLLEALPRWGYNGWSLRDLPDGMRKGSGF